MFHQVSASTISLQVGPPTLVAGERLCNVRRAPLVPGPGALTRAVVR
jgi:hypothetical protein